MKEKVTTGYYQHYKGGIYKVIGVSLHTEENYKLVNYLDANGNMYSRPLTMFIGHATLEKPTHLKITEKRFKYMSNQRKAEETFKKGKVLYEMVMDKVHSLIVISECKYDTANIRHIKDKLIETGELDSCHMESHKAYSFSKETLQDIKREKTLEWINDLKEMANMLEMQLMGVE